MGRLMSAIISLLVITSGTAAFALETEQIVLKPNRSYGSSDKLQVGRAKSLSKHESDYLGSIFAMNEETEDTVNSLSAALKTGKVAVCNGKYTVLWGSSSAINYVKVYYIDEKSCQILDEKKFLDSDN